jgi:hypothetical protein
VLFYVESGKRTDAGTCDAEALEEQETLITPAEKPFSKKRFKESRWKKLSLFNGQLSYVIFGGPSGSIFNKKIARSATIDDI